MTSAVASSWVGTLLNQASNGKIFPRPEQRPGFVVPSSLASASSSTAAASSSARPSPTTEKKKPFDSETTTICEQCPKKTIDNDAALDDVTGTDIEAALSQAQGTNTVARVVSESKTESSPSEKSTSSTTTDETIIVGWYGDDDPENPRNWSPRKKASVTFLIGLLTFGVYSGSAIYTPSIPGVMEEFDVGLTKATLGLSLFVLGYAVGPMFLSPLSEIPAIGRNWTYIPSMIIFVIFNIVASLAPNYSTLMAMRFWTGFFGSPALATGGASISDMYDGVGVAFPIAIWAVGAVCGPVLGPVIGGFSAMNLGWRWPMWLLTILSGVTTIVLALFLPETFEGYLLLQRAKRLRKHTGNAQLRAQSELDQAATSFASLTKESLLRPLIISIEPVVFFTSIYLGVAYACFYLFFESFVIVFTETHRFNLGESGLPFLGLAVSGVFTLLGYLWYLKSYFNPRFLAKAQRGIIIPEDRIGIALFASFFVPVSLFGFGWTSREDIHWIVPIIFSALLLPGVFLLFQSLLVYLPMSYPKYAASVLAANALIRSSFAAAFPLFGHGMFTKLGVGVGCSVLGAIFTVLIVPLWGLQRYGHVLRRHSKYAHVYSATS
ncbi:Major facilitator superfamily [Kalmanozyma brasiliensis GHG001]|uniref:Major facilitator superfamily (MFS) profile domain-containing protein n=1 Tax=Kalmanozyma brasiliensis (strain GHG001) TaxID=1365824 RepID=V5EFJ3_KALBG|nr:Major facilitator superfamily [Kalmanozyma brasiliensis GHG001]EST09266.1 Major facilitator superfamily [Kalmanozyma brasiliensis GHG001]